MKTLFILATMIFTGYLIGQTKKLDCFRGDYLTKQKGLKIIECLEGNKSSELIPLLSKSSAFGTPQLIRLQTDFLQRYKKLEDISLVHRTECLAFTNNDGKCFYERTYYTLKEQKPIYCFQVRVYLDLKGDISSISLFDKNTLTKRNTIIHLKQVNKADVMPIPSPSSPR
jgi:hypothetical protein